MLSLEFVLGFCYGIAKRGDYKVEFIQSFCWFYSIPNLLVIQHLETLYLGGNHVRVVCVRVWRKAQECAIKKSLATGSCDWQVTRMAQVWSMQGELKGHTNCCTTRQNLQSGKAVSSRLIPVASSSRQNTMFGCNWLFTFHTHPTINTFIPTKCRELLEKILREKP